MVRKLLVGAASLAAVAATLDPSQSDRTPDLRQTIVGGRARNVILFVGDGMGDSEITIARNYQVGADGRLAMDALPLTGAYTTHAVHEVDRSRVDYVTDSAASGTAWATGFKTSNGRISTVAGSGNAVTRLTTILERAQAAGFRTGNVSTAEITDATPAVLNAHVNDRACHGPADMTACGPFRKENGGPGSIAEQTVDHHVNVVLGGGRARFEQRITGGPHAGRTVMESARLQGYELAFNSAGLDAAHGDRVLGLFSAGNMSLEWSGAPALPFPGSGLPGGQVCLENRRPPIEPSLAAMTARAIALLDGQRSGGGPGFFLQVEGGSIDKQDHEQNPCQQIGETIAFDRAVAVGLEFAAGHPDTLVVVTADHAHTSQIVSPPGDEPAGRPGSLSTLRTKVDRSPMTIAYATRHPGHSQDHTGSQVRIAALGPQAANVTGITNQTDLFHTLARALGVE